MSSSIVFVIHSDPQLITGWFSRNDRVARHIEKTVLFFFDSSLKKKLVAYLYSKELSFAIVLASDFQVLLQPNTSTPSNSV